MMGPEEFAAIMTFIYETVGQVFTLLDSVILIHSVVDFTLLDFLVAFEFLYLVIGFLLELRTVHYGS